MNGRWFSPARLLAVIVKEFIQMRRDRLTFAMMVGIPIMQLTLFGYAINTDPKHLPIVILSLDQSDLVRSIQTALQNSGYYRVVAIARSREEVDRALDMGEALFAITIPAGFTRDLLRGERPALRLVETPARRHSDKVVQLETRRNRTGLFDGLSTGEQAAFRERLASPEAAAAFKAFLAKRTGGH